MKILSLLSFLLLLGGCATSAFPERHTLRDIDIAGNNNSDTSSFIRPKNEDDIRAAYAEYLNHASKNDISRIDALQRLAQLEFNLSEKLEKNKGEHTANTQDIEDKLYNATLDRSIDLLATSLRDYPKAKNNDKTLYQLAKAYDQKGLYDKSIATLERLVTNYPKSQFYVESEFRLAEYAFSRKEYSKAEDTYTDVIVSRKNSEYLENALYKRGWARFKQEYYQEAIEDYLAAVDLHDFPVDTKQNASQKSQFEEYFRAVGLSFSYLGGAEPLNAYFRKHPGFKFIYHTYSSVSDIYRKQQRYSDAVATLDDFIRFHPKSERTPLASIKILDIWKEGGFTNKLIPALDTYFALYHPQSAYWSAHKTREDIYNSVTTAIKDYTVLAAAYFHKEYIASHKDTGFNNARSWYERYLEFYPSYSRKDNMHLLYAELLSKHNDLAKALYQYEQAAYDSDIILNKDAAYSSILLADRLHDNAQDTETKSKYLQKLINYSLRYTHLYPNDAQSMKIITRASQEAYRTGLFDQTVKLTELYSGKAYTSETYNINMIKANSYFKLKQYQDAESAYQSILTHYRLDAKSKKEIRDNLALSIYDQGKIAAENGNIEIALHDYSRISDYTPESQVAATGLYDAIALCMNNKKWDEAIQYIKKFQSTYPTNKYGNDVSKKLSVAYLNSHQDIAAANELLKISRTENNPEYKSAALWKAGELYESKREYPSAIKSFQEYAETYQRPYPQYIESMQKLTALYSLIRNDRQADRWRKAILDADKRTPEDLKNDRTKLISSETALQLAKEQYATYGLIKLTVPLAKSLERKKYYMQQAVNLYGRASSYGISSISTEATYSIGEIYHSFSKALLESERPKNLNKTELEQYNILLEDKSFPFDDKAIEFLSTNLRHVKEGVYDDWIQKSYDRLIQLYPVRYKRDVKLEPYINVLH